ncbi:hypothetical protein [Streptomyces plumbiresistens]|uniref:Uncharacterized protein n=1 Tax=Streptomyces plumbiresistens TaxID=511811 RepID=A0ABP7RVH9_9ACTN
MSTETVPPPRVARAAEKAGLGDFENRHDRRTPTWRLAAEVALLLPVVILLFAAKTGRPDGAWGWLALLVGVVEMGVVVWRFSPLFTNDAVPEPAPARDLGKLVVYTALLGGYLAWQWHLGWPDNSFGDWLTVVAVTAAVPVLVIGFDILFLAYAPWYTFSEGLVLGNSWGGRRRLIRYADVTVLRYAEWSTSWKVPTLAPGDGYNRRHAEHHWHRLRVRGGRNLRFRSSGLDYVYDDLSGAICAGVAAEQVDGVRATIRDGGEAAFGPITVDRDTIRAGSVSVPWEKVKTVWFSERKLLIETTDGSPGLTFRASRVPNGVTLQWLNMGLQRERHDRDRIRKENEEREARGKRGRRKRRK